MGIPGMIIGVPFFAVVYALIRRKTNKLLRKRGLPTETHLYQEVDYINENAVFIPKNTQEHSTFFKLKIPSFMKKENNSKNDKKNK